MLKQTMSAAARDLVPFFAIISLFFITYAYVGMCVTDTSVSVPSSPFGA